MTAVGIAMLMLPVLAFASAVLALAVAWPRRSDVAEAQRALSLVRLIGMAHLVMWWLAVFLPRALMSRGTRELVIIVLGTMIAVGGLVVTAMQVRRARRGTIWALPHTLFLATYLTELGQDGIAQIL